jgi:predicted RNA-binding Zn ribbon-like protein
MGNLSISFERLALAMPTIVDVRRFELIAGDPALDLVNTLDWRFRDEGTEELLASYDDLLGFCLQSELLTAKQVRQIARSASQRDEADALVSCRQLREASAEIFYAAVDQRVPTSSSMKISERFFKEAQSRRRLVFSSPQCRWELPASDPSPDLPVWLLSLSVERLLISGGVERLRDCGNPDCRWLFLDTSKNHTRRWCDMKICGNRMKARRFKAQHSA